MGRDAQGAPLGEPAAVAIAAPAPWEWRHYAALQLPGEAPGEAALDLRRDYRAWLALLYGAVWRALHRRQALDAAGAGGPGAARGPAPFRPFISASGATAAAPPALAVPGAAAAAAAAAAGWPPGTASGAEAGEAARRETQQLSEQGAATMTVRVLEARILAMSARLQTVHGVFFNTQRFAADAARFRALAAPLLLDLLRAYSLFAPL